jgi:hypothetical protein
LSKKPVLGGKPQRDEEIKLLIEAKEANRLLLMSKPNVIAMGIGLRKRKGEVIDEQVVKVYVSRKIPKEHLDKHDLIPPTLTVGGRKLPVDVEEETMPQAALFTRRSRPLVGGSSIGPTNVVAGFTWAGTLGLCVTLDDGQTYILSNNHVLALVNQLAIGANIVQPGIPDGGIAPTPTANNDLVATLFNFIPIDFGTTTITIFGIRFTIPNRNFVDCALARVQNAFNGANREIHWVGYPDFNIRQIGTDIWSLIANLARPACKMGRTTEYTVGTIIDVAWDGFVDFSRFFGNAAGTNRAWFEDQLLVDGGRRPFIQPGDSGSLVLDAITSQPIGLAFAFLGNRGICNRIDRVMNALGIPRI